MTLRRRLGIAAGAAVGLAVLLAVLVSYFVVRDKLYGQVDHELTAQQASLINHPAQLNQLLGLDGPGAYGFGYAPPNEGGSAPYAQIVLASGQAASNYGLGQQLQLPVDAATRRIAQTGSGRLIETVSADGSSLRMLVFGEQGLVNGQPATFAIQLARPLGPVERVLGQLRLILALVLVGGIGLAVALGRLAADRVLAPLAAVSRTAELIGEDDDLSRRIDVRTDDEVGQLARRFNAMLERLQRSRAQLDASVEAQRQLVADASHELRTPVTSLRTNIEVLLESDHLQAEDRRRLLADVVEQSEELTALVGDLIELARGDLPDEAIEDVRLDRVVEEAVARARRNFPHVVVQAELAPVAVDGSPERLSRAVNNLLDNAARHSPDGGLIEVRVDCDGITVRDHGSGIDPRDLPHVFDRFYRGANSRGRQGSGLGLAIVRQVAEQHGGRVQAANHPDGGAIFTLLLPTHQTLDEAAASTATRT
jgi:two-component system sensor histidine kinase MprB